MRIFEFEVDKNKFEKRPVIFANAEDLLETIIEKRNLVGNYIIKVMADGGLGEYSLYGLKNLNPVKMKKLLLEDYTLKVVLMVGKKTY